MRPAPRLWAAGWKLPPLMTIACASTLPTTSLGIPPTSYLQSQEDQGVATELVSAKPLISSIHENENPPNDLLDDQSEVTVKLKDEPPKRQVETSPSQTPAPNTAEACQGLDNISAQAFDQNSNPLILANEVGQDIDIGGLVTSVPCIQDGEGSVPNVRGRIFSPKIFQP